MAYRALSRSQALMDQVFPHCEAKKKEFDAPLVLTSQLGLALS